MRRKLAGLRVLVTGASQGIGRALVVEAARRGCKVLAAARSAELLDELAQEVRKAGGAVETVAADVTDPADRQAMLDAANAHLGGLDILVNNAGIGATGHFMDTKPETLRHIFEVNYFALCEMVRLFLPTLRRGTTPAIVNVSSVFGRRAWPARSMYSASKFAVQGFSEALRAELLADGIDVTVISPGLTRTNFSKNLLENKAKMSLDHRRGMTAEQVATATWNAVEARKMDVTLSAGGKDGPGLPVGDRLLRPAEGAVPVRRRGRRAAEAAGRLIGRDPRQPTGRVPDGDHPHLVVRHPV